MSTRCFLVDADDFASRQTPGAMWYAPDYAKCPALSAEYHRDHAGRLPICIRLPDMVIWPIDLAFHGIEGGAPGWTITGDPPNLTAMPSVDSTGYHGWLKDGVLSDDLAGRTYDEPEATP